MKNSSDTVWNRTSDLPICRNMKSKLSNFDSWLQRSVRYRVGIVCRFGAFVSSFSVDGIVNGYGLQSPRVRFPAGARDIFFSPKRPDRLLCPRMLLVSGFRWFYQRV